MKFSRTLAALLLATCLVAGRSSGADPAPLAASVESSLATSSRQVRQLAFDGDPKTYFASAGDPGKADHFTLVLDRPVAAKSVEVTTGRPDDSDRLEAGALEVSADGSAFEPVARFAPGGIARFEAGGRSIKAVRIRPDDGLAHPLVIREIALDSAEPVERFRHPVEFVVDVTDAPEMKRWADDAAKTCELWYPRICEELRSDGNKPPVLISMVLRSRYEGVAEASGTRITGSVRYFKAHPDDVGAMIHETCHVVQEYRGRRNPGWLVEGVADYVRFFVYEPGKAGPVDPNRARYDASYRTTATFLDYLAREHDKDIVRKLNALMREGKYREDAFRELTGKPVRELGRDWLESLRP